MPTELSNLGRAYRAAMGLPETAAYLSVAADFNDPAHRLLRAVTPGGFDCFDADRGHLRAGRMVPHADEEDAKELGARFRAEQVTHWTPGEGQSRRFTVRVPGGVQGITEKLYTHDIPRATLVPIHGAVDIHLLSQSPQADAVVVAELAKALNARVTVSRGRVNVLTGMDAYVGQ